MVSIGLFRRVAFLTAFFAYLQIALGGVVRVTGSGLGCPDWPLCHGRPYPPAGIHSLIEYARRSVGTLTGLLLVGTVVVAWIVFRQQRPLVAWLATGSLVAIAAEGALGAVVVANELAPWLVLIHLGLAMIILGFLLATAVMSLPESPGVPSLRRTTALAAGATYVLLLTGSTVVASNADQSCHSWPLCGGGVSRLSEPPQAARRGPARRHGRRRDAPGGAWSPTGDRCCRGVHRSDVRRGRRQRDQLLVRSRH